MIRDADRIGDGTVLQADVAVVGAGPAGIVMALELAKGGFNVLLIESGSTTYDAAAQDLSESLPSDRHASMSLAMRRGVGGTSAIWGGRCVPYDAVDFDRRPLAGDGAWPVTYEELTPLFQRACDWFACGRAIFDAAGIHHLAGRSLVPGLPDGSVLTSTLERWSLPANFAREYGGRLRSSRRVLVVTGLTCTEILCAADGRAVDGLAARTLRGTRVRVIARRYVIACGALETTRLLLTSASRHPSGIGNHAGHLGRWYMAHLEGEIANVHFTTPPRATSHGFERDVDGVYVRRRLSFSREFLLERGLPNIVAWLANPTVADASHHDASLSLAYLALVSPLGHRLAPDALRRAWLGEDIPGVPYPPATKRSPVRAHLRNVARNLSQAASFAVVFGGGRYIPWRRRHVPSFFAYSPDNTYPLQYHGEHLPNRESRVELSDERDMLGMPRLRIALRFSDEDVEGVVRAHREWDEHLQRHGRGRLEYVTGDLRDSVSSQAGGGFHQAGTTRMSRDPRHGVVGPDLAVHGFHDLFVASSSVFVTSSQANPTFMLIVFVLRLADRLRAELRRSAGLADNAVRER